MALLLFPSVGEEVDAEQIKSSYYSILKEEKKKEAAAQLPPISGGDLALQGLMGPSPSPAAAAIANKVKANKGKVTCERSEYGRRGSNQSREVF